MKPIILLMLVGYLFYCWLSYQTKPALETIHTNTTQTILPNSSELYWQVAHWQH